MKYLCPCGYEYAPAVGDPTMESRLALWGSLRLGVPRLRVGKDAFEKIKF